MKKAMAIFLGFLLSVFLLVLFFPFPHAGSLFENIIHDSKHKPQQQQKSKLELKLEQEAVKQQRITELRQLSASWFSGRLEIEVEQKVFEWNTGTFGELTVYMDEETGLLWSEPQAYGLTNDEQGRKKAIELCRKLPPQGYWSLPSRAEFVHERNHLSEVFLPNSGGWWLMYQYDHRSNQAQPEIITMGFAGERQQRYQVRCVALSLKAPAEGYISADVTPDIEMMASAYPRLEKLSKDKAFLDQYGLKVIRNSEN